MPKRRTLKPQSLYARKHLEKWLVDDLEVKPIHRIKIWKGAQKGPVAEIQDSIPRVVREQFDKHFVLTTSQVVEEQVSESGGGKLVVKLQDGHLVETVMIRHDTRTTVCVSSQVGCQMGCTFCATGTMGLLANLTAAEIVEQVHHAKQRGPVNNVVFMGMGEPLDNYDNVIEAIQSLAEHSVFSIPFSKITLSTVGVVHAIKRLARECPEIQLALSLHAPNDDIRETIVPTTKAFKTAKIMEAVDAYQAAGGRRMMIEYIMIDGVNSSKACAHDLGKLLSGRNCMVNLIPYNPTEAGDRYNFKAPSDQALVDFQKVMLEYRDSQGKYITCTVRWSSREGQDIEAACGQLALKNINKKECSEIEDLGTTKGKTWPTTRRKSAKRKELQPQTEFALPSLPVYYWAALCSGVALLSVALFQKTRR